MTWRTTPVARSSTACAQQLATAFDESWRSLIDHRADTRRTEPRSRWEVVSGVFRVECFRVECVRAAAACHDPPHPKPMPIVVRADHLLPDLALPRKNSITMCSANPHHIDSALPPRRSPVLRLWRFAHALSTHLCPAQATCSRGPRWPLPSYPMAHHFPPSSPGRICLSRDSATATRNR